MKPKKILLSFVGNRDPYVNNEPSRPGPILSFLEERSDFACLALLHTPDEEFEKRKWAERVSVNLL